MRKKSFFLSLLFLFLLLTPGRLFAWKIDSMSVEAVLRPDSTAVITEDFRVDFEDEQRHGIFRDVPVHYTDKDGTHFKMRLMVLSVTDENGRPWNYTLESAGRYQRIKIGRADTIVTGTQTYRVMYQVTRGAIRYFQGHDEFYWNLTGNEWPVPIYSASARIYFPAQPADAIAFVGPAGSRKNLPVLISADSALLSVSDVLEPREGMTVALRWPKGVFSQPSQNQLGLLWLFDNWVFGVPVFVFLAMFWLWWVRGRDPEIKKSVMAFYEPPYGMTPAEMGALLDQKADMKDITATVINLAVLGYIKIETDGTRPLFGQADYTLTSLKPWYGSALSLHETTLLDSLFSVPGKSVKVSGLRDKFYVHLNKIRENIYADLIRRDFYKENPEAEAAWYIVIGIAAGACIWGFFMWFEPSLHFPDDHYVAVAIISGVIIAAFGPAMPRRTFKGAEAAGKIKGFREFLIRVDEDRIKRINDPSLFEKGLPYAMAFGVAGQWAHAFEGIYAGRPQWYGGPGDSFSSSSFERDMNSAASSMNSSFVSQPGSDSSGFGGGGSSGGGGGGGGGGAW